MEYRFLRLEERGLIKDLFESYYDSSIYCTESSYFDWLHRFHPQHQDVAAENEFTVLAAIDGDRLLGCISFIPGEICLGEARYSAVITTESLARPEASGVFGLLARRLTGRFDVALIMGATEQLRGLYTKRLGAHYRHEISRRLLIGDDVALERLLGRHPESVPIDSAQLRTWSRDTQKLAAGQQWASIEAAGKLEDHYWQHMLSSGLPCLRRDPQWLEWRYLRHPHLQYQVISTDSSQSAGIAILRCEQLDAIDCQVLRLLEFLPTAGHHEALAGAVAKYVVETQSAFLDVFCAHDGWISRLPPAFVPFQEHSRHDIPYLLQPPEWRPRRSINLLSIRNRRRPLVPPELHEGQLYLTKGDGAQDVALNRTYRSAHLRQDASETSS